MRIRKPTFSLRQLFFFVAGVGLFAAMFAERSRLTELKRPVATVVSNEARHVVFAYSTGQVRQLQDGVLRPLSLHLGSVPEPAGQLAGPPVLQIGDDGQTLIAVRKAPSQVFGWDVAADRQLWAFAVSSPDELRDVVGEWIVTTHNEQDGCRVVVWNGRTGARHGELLLSEEPKLIKLAPNAHELVVVKQSQQPDSICEQWRLGQSSPLNSQIVTGTVEAVGISRKGVVICGGHNGNSTYNQGMPSLQPQANAPANGVLPSFGSHFAEGISTVFPADWLFQRFDSPDGKTTVRVAANGDVTANGKSIGVVSGGQSRFLRTFLFTVVFLVWGVFSHTAWELSADGLARLQKRPGYRWFLVAVVLIATPHFVNQLLHAGTETRFDWGASFAVIFLLLTNAINASVLAKLFASKPDASARDGNIQPPR